MPQVIAYLAIMTFALSVTYFALYADKEYNND